MFYSSLKTKMSVIVSMLMTAILMLLAVAAFKYFEKQFRDIISRQQFTLVSAMAEEIDDKLGNAQEALVAIAKRATPELSGDHRKAQVFLDDQAGTHTVFDDGIIMFSPAGILVASSPPEPTLLGRDYTFRDYIRKTVATRKPQISAPFFSTQSHHHPMIMFTAPFFDDHGNLAGIVAGGLDLMRNNFLGKLAAIRIGKKGYLYLYSSDRTMIVHPDRTRILRKDVPPGANRLFDLAIQGFEGTDETVNSRGLHAVSSFKHLKSTNWILAANFPKTEVYAPIDEAKRYLLIALGAILVFSNIIVWWVMGRLTAPLLHFTEHVRGFIARGGEPKPVPITTDDEIGTLGKSFNEMLAEMERQKWAIREQQEFSENLLLNSAIPTFVLDAGHRVIIWNKACEELTGIKAGQVLGTTDSWKAFYREDRPLLADIIIEGDIDELSLYASYIKSPFTPDGLQAEGWCMNPSGGERFVFMDAVPVRKATGDIVAVIQTVQDITEKRRSGKELELKNIILSTQQETSIDGILMVDENNRIISYNQRFAELWDMPVELLKRGDDAPVLELVTSRVADSEGFLKRVEYLYEQREEKSRDEVLLKDGRVFDRYSAPVLGADGKHFGRVWYLRDITERKQMEEELRSAQKLESLGVLAGGIAHDFNNLLTGILGNISLAKIMTGTDSKAFKRLDEAEKAVNRARDLTQQLMTFSKGGAPVKKTASIEKIVMDSASFVLRGSNVRCEFSVSDDVWPVEVDEGQMNQVINNLIINADQSMAEGGILEVGIENLTVAPENDMSLTEGRYVKIYIRDHGVGIPEKHLHKIFDPYFTTKQKGNGLGLATVYSIIRNHGGYIGVESKVGVGTTFQIYIPASENGLLEVTEKKENIHAGSGKILVMDDEEIIREVAAEILGHLGYSTVLCCDGSEAIELYRQAIVTKEPFSAVIMDLTIPGGMGGKETMKKLLEIDKGVVGIVSSGYCNDPILSSYSEYGFSGIVEKPYSLDELGKVLNDLLTGGGSLQQ